MTQEPKRLRIVGENFSSVRVLVDNHDISDMISLVSFELKPREAPWVCVTLQPECFDIDIPALASIHGESGDIDIEMPAVTQLANQLYQLNKQIEQAATRLEQLKQDAKGYE